MINIGGNYERSKKGKQWFIELECTGDGNHWNNGKKGSLPCHRLLEITGKDIFKTVSHSGIDNSTTEFFTFKCVYCNCLTDIDTKLLSSEVIQYARHRTEEDIDREARYPDNDNTNTL